MIVKNNLRILMAKHKMNIQDVHKLTGLSRTTISKLYNETSTKIGFDTIAIICKLFDCEISDLLFIDKVK
ncbi:putative XRE family transcriptional regulator [Niallia circulans]|jgi:putative transcriptional regulator|uniref:helix-turn-helix domain-containing protein n=1 Tax=Niallia circulans TaxID=1397 RepID=UPI0009EF14D8|nr:helix-turn-helix transcriptional regulator [Niallia circulans]MDR4315021.1 helix-turn-helix transcriptional regulator [Niallia circulans]MED3839749.1 helix-turn-helix transcriptional regulator [Niallia circulans]MED4241235.1 helix-turn-helix transcriptional regulator [Niallia circulans]MED4247896.1 helix-turn-helix transcriptional regulator [Niallia circulans]QKH61623.1 helix-turn-helix transcriptional regulator [Niallia circulans]